MATFTIASSFNVDLLGRQLESKSNGEMSYVAIPFGQYKLPSFKWPDVDIIYLFELIDYWVIDSINQSAEDVSGKVEFEINNYESVILELCKATRSEVVILTTSNQYFTKSTYNIPFNLNINSLSNKSDISELLEVDMDSVFEKYGYVNLISTKYWQLAQSPFSEFGLEVVANEILEFDKHRRKNSIRLIITDLDDTIWSGVLSEQGIGGISCSGAYPGSAHRLIQWVLLEAKKKGVILAISSKNSLKSVKDVLSNKRDMLLKIDDFVSIKANYNPKSENIKSIIQSLNLRPESVLFLDDNYLERREVSTLIPNINVVDLSEDRTLWWYELSQALSLYFDKDDDSNKTIRYRNKLKIDEGVKSAIDRSEFFRELNIKISICEVNDSTIGRCQELVLKSNQFNLTQNRLKLDDIKNDGVQVLSVDMSDSFGGNEIIGVVIISEFNGAKTGSFVIENLVLSCRVLGRGIEEYLLWYLGENYFSGASSIQVRYEKKSNNNMALDFIRRYSELNTERSVVSISKKLLEEKKPEWIEGVEAVC